jgi:hypothetical protein
VKAVFTPARVKQIADMLAERKGVIRAREEVLSKLMVGFEKGQKPEFVLCGRTGCSEGSGYA